MILNLLPVLLLVPVLLGEVDVQRHDVTQEELTTHHHTVMKMNNASLDSWTPLMDDELQNNRTSAVVTEDEEDFQDQQDRFPWQQCQQELLVFYCEICEDAFDADMSALRGDDRCVLDNFIRSYDQLTLCVETTSNLVGCFFPNKDVEDFFLHIHATYFQGCAEDEPVRDAPYGQVVALTLAPVSLIPVLVYMVIWKSKTTT